MSDREPHLPSLPPRPERPIAVVGVTVVPMTGPERLPDQTVVITGDRITAMGPRAEVDTSGAHVIDAAGKYLMPGLTDSHAHLVDFADSVMFLASGVTRIRHMFGYPEHLAYGRLVDEGRWAGPRMISASTLVDGVNAAGKPNHAGSYVVQDDAAAQRLVPFFKNAGYAHIKGYSLLSPQGHAALGRAARDHDFPLGGHCPRQLTFEQAIANGQTSFEHLMNIGRGRLGKEGNEVLERAVESDAYPEFDPPTMEQFVAALDMTSIDRLAQQMADQTIWSCPTLIVLDRMCAPPEDFASESWVEHVAPHWIGFWNSIGHFLPGWKDLAALRSRVRETNLAVLSSVHEAGVPLMVGTDTPNPWVPPGVSVLAELENFVAAGISPYDALRYATVEPARFLGLPEGSATVQVGQLADLVLLDGDPLASIRAVGDVNAVFANGWHLDAAALDSLRSSLKVTHDEAATSAVEVSVPTPADARVRVTQQLASRILGVQSGSLAYRCCDLPDGRQIIDEVEELFGNRIERQVTLTPEGGLISGRVDKRTPVGAATYEITANGTVRVSVDDHGMRETVDLPADGPVLAGLGASTVGLALGTDATAGSALALTRTGPRVLPVSIDRGEQVTSVYDHWSVGMPTSVAVQDGVVVGGADLADTFPRSLETPAK